MPLMLSLIHINANVSVCACVCSCLVHASSLAFGNCNGLAVVDYLQKTLLLCMSTLDMYGAADPYQRLTRSPRRNRQSTSGNTHTHTHFHQTPIQTSHHAATLHNHCPLPSLLLSSRSFLCPPLSSVTFCHFLPSKIRLIHLVNRTR